MNPNEALAALLSAVARHDAAAFRAADEALRDPRSATPDELQALADDLRLDADTLHVATGRRDDDEAHDDDTLGFRLYIRPDGELDLQTGDAQYDTDHRGYCGVGEVSPHDDDGEILAALLSAFDDACESAACALPALPHDDDGEALALHSPHDDGSHTLAVERIVGGEWQEVSRRAVALHDLRALYFRLVSYAMEPPLGMDGERFVVDGALVYWRDAASLRTLAETLTRCGVSL